MRLFAWALALFIVFTGLAAGMRGVGQIQTPPPTYLETEGCSGPCWQGVRPGVSTNEQFAAQLARAPYTGYQWWEREDNTIDTFQIAPSIHFQITLADVIRVLGAPDRAGCLRLHSADVVSGFVYFNGGLVQVMVWRDSQEMRYTPEMQVNNIVYYSALERGLVERTSPWQGFTTASVYRQCR